MAEVTISRVGGHLRKLVEILLQHPDGLGAKSALEKLAASVQMTEYEKGVYPSTGTRRFEKIVRFGTVDLVKAGWIVKDKGIWAITPLGVEAYDKYPDPEKFYREAIRLYGLWRKAHGGQVEEISSESNPEEANEKDARVTYEQAEEQAWDEIEAFVGAMPPYEFQDLVSDLLKALGYYVSWVSPPGKDGGIDIIAHVDPLGTQPPRVKVQVKRTIERISVTTLNSFLALIDDGDVGLFVSTGGFTKDSEDAARRQTNRKITLIDLDRLVELWIEAYEKLGDKARQRLPLTPIYFLTPEA
jgi:restriction system protein